MPAYAGLDYTALAETKEEWPPVGTSNDLYFGGTAYDNRGGVGAQTKSLFEIDGRSELKWIEPPQPTDQPLKVRRLNRHWHIDRSIGCVSKSACAKRNSVEAGA